MTPPRQPEPQIVRPPGVRPDAILRVLRVPPEAARMRLDLFVKTQLRSTSRTRARAIVENSAYTPDGRQLRPSARVDSEDRVALWRPSFEPDASGPELVILYQDPHLLVVDKPPLVTVHPTARYHRQTVIKRLEAERPGEFLSLIHRLDRETSGILMVARSAESDRCFKRLMEARTAQPHAQTSKQGFIEKVYLGITRGVPPTGLVVEPLEVDPESRLGVKMRVARRGHGLSALTHISVQAERAGYALVVCQLYTGRQHQIRVHLASLGCPVVGDKLYGQDERLLARAADGELTEADQSMLELPRHALHAHRYCLRHAMTGAELALVSPLPEDLRRFWDGLDQV